MPPVAPMLAKAATALPDEPGLLFEPKWDGFRCIVFRDGDEVELGSRNERPLTRYFPELVAALRAQLPPRVVLDGEIVIATPEGLDFDALQQRIHPAESRISRLAAETPASFVAFDVLALGDESLLETPFGERRRTLESALAGADGAVKVTPVTTDPAEAQDWFVRFEGAGLDGVVAKSPDLPYQPDKRVMIKVKHRRTAEAVVAGFRVHKSGDGVGSLLLGLYDDEGQLHHIGVASSFTAKRRRELLDELAPYREGALDDHPWRQWAEASAHVGQRMPGNVSRWNAGKDLSFEPLRPELVAEIAYEQLQSGRLRHGARLLHWRPDRDPASCRYDQLEQVAPVELHRIFGV